MQIAHEYRDERVFFFPHTIDFRGRAYPMHAHLTHLGSDVNRGLLQFAESQPLGERGLYWLHLQVVSRCRIATQCCCQPLRLWSG